MYNVCAGKPFSKYHNFLLPEIVFLIEICNKKTCINEDVHVPPSKDHFSCLAEVVLIHRFQYMYM